MEQQIKHSGWISVIFIQSIQSAFNNIIIVCDDRTTVTMRQYCGALKHGAIVYEHWLKLSYIMPSAPVSRRQRIVSCLFSINSVRPAIGFQAEVDR